MQAFLNGDEIGALDMFQEALNSLGLPPLKPRYQVPSIDAAFDDIRPHILSKTEELHGIFAAGWSYLGKIKSGGGPAWATGGSQLETTRIVNDLTEKSIRNASIRQMWSRGAK